MLDKNAIEYFYKDLAIKRYGKRGFLPLRMEDISTMLEIGGGSTFSLQLTGLAVCVDISLPLLKIGKLRYKEGIFVRAEARHLPFRKDIFDVVIARALLHHLIGRTSYLCNENIARAIREMERVRARKGIILVAEVCTLLKMGGLLAFYITKLLARLNIEIPSMEIRSNVVVYFLTLKKLTSALKMHGLKYVILKRDPWRIKGIPIGESVIIMFKE